MILGANNIMERYEIILTLIGIGIAGFAFFHPNEKFFFVKKVLFPCLLMIIASIFEYVFIDTSIIRKANLLAFLPLYLLGGYWITLGYKNIIMEIKDKFKG